MEQKKSKKRLIIIIAIAILVIVAIIGVGVLMSSKVGNETEEQKDTQNKIELTTENVLDYLNIKYIHNTYKGIYPNNAIQVKFSDIGFDIYPTNGIRFENLKIKLAMDTGHTTYTLCNIKNKNKVMQGIVSEDEENHIIFYEVELSTNGTFNVNNEFVVFTSSLTAPNSPFPNFYVDSVSGYVVVEE